MTDVQQALAQVREALAAGPTPGPWRWEVSAHGKRLQLVGGLRPQYDLTVMGFARWGMSGATIKLRDLARDGLNLLYRLHERAEWIAPIPGREHHANWCSTVTHPDAAFIAKCNPENIAAILAHVEAQEAEIERLRAGLQAVSDLIDESHGVAGLHRNGDVAPWGDLRTGGKYEEWLVSFDDALKEQG